MNASATAELLQIQAQGKGEEKLEAPRGPNETPSLLFVTCVSAPMGNKLDATGPLAGPRLLLEEASSETSSFINERLWTPLDPTGTPRLKLMPLLYETHVFALVWHVDPTGPHAGPHLFLKEASRQMAFPPQRAYSYYNTK